MIIIVSIIFFTFIFFIFPYIFIVKVGGEIRKPHSLPGEIPWEPGPESPKG